MEYIHQLQQRQKRFKDKIKIHVGDLVLLVEEDVPAMKWLIGRVSELHPGKDNVVRVVTVKTKNGQKKRSVSKICLLPIENQAFQGDAVCFVNE